MYEGIVFVAAKRTPFGAFGGTLKDQTATDLAVHAAKAALAAGNIDPAAIDHSVFGNVLQTSADAPYLARHVALRAGVPETTPAVTVNRLCGSGFEALADAANRLTLGQAACVLAGGAESMSQAPFALRQARFGQRLGHGEVEDTLTAALTDAYAGMAMALTAEGLAEDKGITRAECDAWALSSQKRADAAAAEGKFAEEIAPYVVSARGKKTHLEKDEHVRPDVTAEGLAKLRPVFKKDGVVTAGNASGMVDGACALVVTTRAKAKSEGWAVLGELVASTVVGCAPKRMGIGPVPAIQALFRLTGKKLEDVHWIEINEAFCAQYLAVERELKLPSDRTNADGGATALGHPLAATGARLVAHSLFALKRRGGGLAVTSACIGGGQGMALLLKV